MCVALVPISNHGVKSALSEAQTASMITTAYDVTTCSRRAFAPRCSSRVVPCSPACTLLSVFFRTSRFQEMNKEFYCETCGKQYKNVGEMSNHLSSYDHHHVKASSARARARKPFAALFFLYLSSCRVMLHVALIGWLIRSIC